MCNTTKRGEWHRVSRSRPCLICGRPKWCSTAGPIDNPTAAICARIESDIRCGEAGWLHILRDDGRGGDRLRSRVVEIEQPQIGAIDFDDLAVRCVNAANVAAICALADSLGVTIGALRRLAVGWASKYGAWAWPMRDATGRAVGIRLRKSNGDKFSVKGGKEGLFLPADLADDDLLLICEGASDCAALLDLGFAAVGRPSCSGGVRHVVDLVQRRHADQVVIVADRDEPGQRGAANLASVLAVYVASVRTITPPEGIKDARVWKQVGATHEDVIDAIDAAPAKMLAINAKRMEARR